MSNKVNSFQVGGDTYGIIPDLTFDNYPTEGSSNPVTSDGIARAVQGAAVGTDISVGRTPGTDIGYCSIAYGTNNVASADYSVVFGRNNKAMSDTSIVSGYGNTNYLGFGNIIAGNGCSSSGFGTIVCGYQCGIGSYITDVTTSDMYIPEIYVGYLNLNTKKLYYDPEMTSENVITFSPTYNYGTTYIVDLTSDTGRTPGTIYEYTRFRSGRVDTISLSVVLNQYVFLTDICRNSLYFYQGPSYYDAANDKNYRNYSAGVFSDEIVVTAYINLGFVFFDLISGYFLLYCKNKGDYPSSVDHPNWLKIKAYRCDIQNYRYVFNSKRYGRYAYVYTNQEEDRSKCGRVYTSSDYSETSDITNQLLDGEFVIDMSNCDYDNIIERNAYKYRFDVNHTLAYVSKTGQTTNRIDSGWEFYIGNGSSVFGNGNTIDGGNAFGSIIAGRNNTIHTGNNGSAIFGRGNTLNVGVTDGGPETGIDAGIIMAGIGNGIDTRSTECHSGYIIGESNSCYIDSGDHIFMNGWNNSLSGHNMGRGAYISGTSNSAMSINDSHIIGRSNNLYFEAESLISGSFNTIGSFINRQYNSSTGKYDVTSLAIVSIHINKSGIYEGSGVSYDSVNQTYTFDTNKIYMIYGIPETFPISTSYYEDRTSEKLLGIKISTDGHTLSDFMQSPLSHLVETNSVYAMGLYNNYIRTIDTVGAGYSNRGNIIFGRNNKMYSFGNDTNVLIGKGLIYFHAGPASPIQEGGTDYDMTATQGTVIVGKYNAMQMSPDGTYDSYAAETYSQFIVGIGTNENDRKNGFIVYTNGIASLPNNPDSVSEASRLAMFNPNKLLVTLGMLRDYAPQTPGAVGKPAVTTVTLAANGWTGTDQTVQVTGITAGAVVIAQANGSPYAYNQHSIYLSAQADDELTFTCATLPSVDVSVKVVYWT